jgi:pimeloyl-ACP methyl ester carboxylesterase
MGIDKFIYTGASHGAGTGWHVVLNYPERVKAFVAYVGGPHNISEAQFSLKCSATKKRKSLNFRPIQTTLRYYAEGQRILNGQ